MLQGYGSEPNEAQINSELAAYAELVNSEGLPLDHPQYIWEDHQTLTDEDLEVLF